jgi:CDP-glycerol glycerophosphotransferase (TagB/SpsB family)
MQKKFYKFLSKLLNPIFKILYVPVNYFFMLIPKDENIWVFGSWFGRLYNDNPRYFFEYLHSNQSEHIKKIWLSRSSEVRSLLRGRGFRVFHPLSIFGIYYSARAKFAFFSQSNNSDISWVTNNGSTKLIQLWHGIPLKKIGSDDQILFTRKKRKKNIWLSSIKEKLFPFKKEIFDLMIACSELDKKSFESAFKVRRVEITGYPRNDALVSQLPQPPVNEKIIVYLPTFRGAKSDEFDLFDKYGFNASEIDSKLREINSKLLIKTHPVNRASQNIVEQISSCKNIKIVNEDQDAIELVRGCDILITDYSSVFFDFLLTQRPIIFSAFDMDDYLRNDREFYYEYESVTPGPRCKSWTEVLSWIDVFVADCKAFEAERAQMRNRFHENMDGNFSERLYKKLVFDF